jgi:CRISPR-associated protein Cmr4
MIECLTNMHVGSGESNYSIVDNEVERDSVLGDPTIHASGIKGSLREHCERTLTAEQVKSIFGSDPAVAQKNKEETTPGNLKFLPAQLLARPLRVSDGERSFILATSQELLDLFENQCDGLDSAHLKVEVAKCSEVREVEGIRISTFVNVGGWLCARLNSLKNQALPIVARNQLDDNGISKNLWYEEIVPHKSVFYFFVQVEESDKDIFKAFKDSIEKSAVQIGGNASVGYGYTRIREVPHE